jgi:hypothetical protein
MQILPGMLWKNFRTLQQQLVDGLDTALSRAIRKEEAQLQIKVVTVLGFQPNNTDDMVAYCQRYASDYRAIIQGSRRIRLTLATLPFSVVSNEDLAYEIVEQLRSANSANN